MCADPPVTTALGKHMAACPACQKGKIYGTMGLCAEGQRLKKAPRG